MSNQRQDIKNVLMIGPSPDRSKGGMATVIQGIRDDSNICNKYNVDIYESYIDGSPVKRAAFSLKQEMLFRLRKHNADIYHIHSASGTSFWRKRRYIRSLGKDARYVILHIHGASFEKFYNECTQAQQRKIQSLFTSVGEVIVLSPEWREFFITNSLCDPEKITILPNAVDIPEKQIKDYSKNNVLFMGRLNERKAPDLLLKAAAVVLKKHPEAHFTFAGDGDIATYEQLAHELGIFNACSFLGWITGKDKEATYMSNDIFCLPSKAEGLPMSILESMSYGLVTIATSVGGIPSIINNGINGFLIPVDNVEMLTEILIQLMDDDQLKQQIGQQGRALIEHAYNIESYTKRLTTIYDEVSG